MFLIDIGGLFPDTVSSGARVLWEQGKEREMNRFALSVVVAACVCVPQALAGPDWVEQVS